MSLVRVFALQKKERDHAVAERRQIVDGHSIVSVLPDDGKCVRQENRKYNRAYVGLPVHLTRRLGRYLTQYPCPSAPSSPVGEGSCARRRKTSTCLSERSAPHLLALHMPGGLEAR